MFKNLLTKTLKYAIIRCSCIERGGRYDPERQHDWYLGHNRDGSCRRRWIVRPVDGRGGQGFSGHRQEPIWLCRGCGLGRGVRGGSDPALLTQSRSGLLLSRTFYQPHEHTRKKQRPTTILFL